MSRKPFVCFLCGPHTSGKTSILKRLVEDGILSTWGSEIGKELFYERRFSTAEQDENFEFEVTMKELTRDFIYRRKGLTVGIETWHPGNLAYATERNPGFVDTLIRHMKTSPFLETAFGIRFTISQENIIKRTQTFKNDVEWAGMFYSRIGEQLEACIGRLGLARNCVTVDANTELEEVYRVVKTIITKRMRE